MALCPLAGRLIGVRNEMPKPRVRKLVAYDRGIELAVKQHRQQLLARRRALDHVGVAIFGNVRILERDPLDLVETHAIVLREYAPNPRAGGDRIGAHADPLARKLGWLEHSALGIVGDGMVLAAANDDGGQQHIRFAVRFRLEVGDNRELGEIVCRLSHNLLEQIVRNLDLDEVEIDEIRPYLAALERFGVGIVSQHGMKLHSCAIGHGIILFPTLPAQDKAPARSCRISNPDFPETRLRASFSGAQAVPAASPRMKDSWSPRRAGVLRRLKPAGGRMSPRSLFPCATR